MSFCVCAIASVSLYGVRKARMVIICLIYTSVCLYRLVYTLYLLYTGSKCNQHCKCRVNVSVMKLLIGLLPLYYVINSQYKHHAGTRNTATGCDIYCPHHNSAHIHTHTHQSLDLAYSLPQHTWHPLIITVSCCRALMINLCSFLGLSWDVLNTMISLASVFSDLISEVFDHNEQYALLLLQTTSAWTHPNRLRHPAAAHSLDLNNTSHLFVPGPPRVRGSAPCHSMPPLAACLNLVWGRLH